MQTFLVSIFALYLISSMTLSVLPSIMDPHFLVCENIGSMFCSLNMQEDLRMSCKKVFHVVTIYFMLHFPTWDVQDVVKLIVLLLL